MHRLCNYISEKGAFPVRKLKNPLYLHYKILRMMKLSAFILTLCAALGLAGCTPTPVALERADTLVREHPDSAMQLLKTIRKPASLSRRDYALFALLVTQARCQLREDLTQDTLSYIAVDYFRNTTDSANAYKSYFYAGQVARAMKRPELAISNYLKGNAFLETSRNFNQHYISNTWLGVLNSEQGLHDAKIVYSKRALRYADSLGNDRYRCISLNDIAYGFVELKQYDSARYYTLRALDAGRKANLTRDLSPTYTLLSYIDYAMGDFSEALKHSNQALSLLPEGDRRICSQWIDKARIQARMGRCDSTFHCLAQAEKIGIPSLADRQVRVEAYALAYEKMGRLDSALSFQRQYNLLQDSIYEEEQSARIFETQQVFRYDQLREQNLLLKEQKVVRDRWIYRIILIFGTLLLVGVVVHFRRDRLRKLHIIGQQNQLIRQQEYLRRKEAERLHAETRLSEMDGKVDQLKTAFFRQLTQRFIPASGKDVVRLGDADWKVILGHADAIFDGFTRRLHAIYPALNEEDIRYCCMVKMQLSHSEIARIVCLEKDSVKKRMRRIRLEKMKSGEGSTLESLLRNF